MLKLRQTLELKIHSLNTHGQGEALYEDYLIDVEDAIPGDVVKASITFISKEKIYAKTFEILHPSELRNDPSCPQGKLCGGCSWQGIAYAEQLKLKKIMIENELQKQDLKMSVCNVVASPEKEYRSKIQLPLKEENQKIYLGHFQKDSHHIINMDHCDAHPQQIQKLIAEIKASIVENKISIYNEKKHQGLLRHLVIRYSHAENKCLLTFVINADEISDELKLLARIFSTHPLIKGLCVNFNSQIGNTILGREQEILWGDDVLFESVGGQQYLHNVFFKPIFLLQKK